MPILLHFLARFQEPPRTTDAFARLTGKAPAAFQDFLARNRTLFLPPGA